MANEVSIVLGLVSLTGFFIYLNDQFSGEKDISGMILQKLFFGLSMTFILIIILVLYQVADNSGLTYLTNGILGTAAMALMGLISVGVIGYYVVFLTSILKMLYDVVFGKSTNRQKTDGDEP